MGDSLNNAEMIRGPDHGPRHTIESVELANLGWVHRLNNDRIHNYLNEYSPTQFEAAHAATQTNQQMVGIQ